MEPAEEALRRRIAGEGAVSVADYMEAANRAYYAARDPLGREGDFITAPEISQMFGELVGIWCADMWIRAGRPDPSLYVELGPGRGTLARDALRAMAKVGLAPRVHLVETSPALRAAQADRLPDAAWHDQLASVPEDAPWLVVANEFFDALPVHQHDGEGRELMVRLKAGRFVRDAAARIVESSPMSVSIASELAQRLVAQGGAALIIDYGRPGGEGDTLQSVARHQWADPWEAPGTRDLTALVDFDALARAALDAGARIFGPVPQGYWLESMGIGARAAALSSAAPDQAAEIEAARTRLVAPEQMGTLFQVVAVTSPAWPEPAGFA